MAKEYIDREAFLADKRKQYCSNCDRRKGMKNGKLRFCYEIGDAPCRSCGIGDVLDDVEDYPAADVVEVVRCRDCIHSRPWYAEKSLCFLWHESGIGVFNDGFCNYGDDRKKSRQLRGGYEG